MEVEELSAISFQLSALDGKRRPEISNLPSSLATGFSLCLMAISITWALAQNMEPEIGRKPESPERAFSNQFSVLSFAKELFDGSVACRNHKPVNSKEKIQSSCILPSSLATGFSLWLKVHPDNVGFSPKPEAGKRKETGKPRESFQLSVFSYQLWMETGNRKRETGNREV